MGVLTQFFADQFRAGQHIAPLVVAAELHVAAVFFIQAQEVIGLHDHVVEFQEGKSLLHSLLIASGAEHIIDGEMNADITDEFNIIEVAEPVGIVDHQSLVGSEFNEAAHLLLEALAVVVDLLDRHHGPEILSSGRVSDHTGTAADECDRLVAGLLQTLHQKQGHKVTDMKRVGGRVKTNIESRLAVVDQVSDLILVCQLGQKPSCLQFLKNMHVFFHR